MGERNTLRYLLYLCIYIKPGATGSVYMNVFCNTESFLSSLFILGYLNMNSTSNNIKNYYGYFLSYCYLFELTSHPASPLLD